ncbi:MAG: ATP-binding protein [Candidatus Thiodiazotropha endolucinida]|nr:ATP-binding protein [Candidatus Thiodiazotropha endolucinida]
MKTEVELSSDYYTSDLQSQHHYVESLKSRGDSSYTLVAAEAFVRGMRDSGYKSTATAIDEFVDNSIQAAASRVDIISVEKAGKGGRGSKSTVGSIAVIDDGHGMEPDMLRASILWGGTHREGDRSGLGRYGFGLPSAAVSITEHYEVYSCTPEGEWHRVAINLLDIANGVHTDAEGRVVAPKPEKVDLPDFISDYLSEQDLTLESGTVVVLADPDRLSTGFVRPSSFEEKMLQHIGLIYRGLLRGTEMHVNGKAVECVDPLFLTSGCRYYDVGNGYIANAMDPLVFNAKNANGKSGQVRMRFSWMHPEFQKSSDGKGWNPRMKIMRENQAYLIVCRAGRQIDLVDKTQYQKPGENYQLVNYDRNWAVEIDFDPVLDELFGITVNKQQVSISERMWQTLSDNSIPAIVKSLKKQFDSARSDAKGKSEAETGSRESERIAEEASEFQAQKTTGGGRKQKESTEKVKREAERRAKKTGKPIEEEVKDILDEIAEQKYKVEFEELEGAPFYRPEQFGSQTRIYINTRHRFFTDFYDAPDSSRRIKTMLELMIFVLARAELSSTGDRELFYERERGEWSTEMNLALRLLDRHDPVDEAKEAEEEA